MGHTAYSIFFITFLLLTPFSNIPIIFNLLNNITLKNQKKIIARECLFTLIILLITLFLGYKVLDVFGISQSSINIAGGIVLFLISLRLVFPSTKGGVISNETINYEAFIVPIAVPLLAGPSVLTTIVFFSLQTQNKIDLVLPIFLAWLTSSLVIFFGNNLDKKLGKRMMRAIDRLMGMILMAMSINYILFGIKIFLGSTNFY